MDNTKTDQSAESGRTDQDWLDAVDWVRKHYPEDVFPPLGASLDCASARFARGLCDEIVRTATQWAADRAEEEAALNDGEERPR